MALGVVLRYGAQYLRFDGHPCEFRPRHKSWWLLCLSRGGFEGDRASVLTWSSSVHQLEGPADGDPEVHNDRCGGVPLAQTLIVCWLHSAREGGTAPGMVTQGQR
jgi:hypothetical protein